MREYIGDVGHVGVLVGFVTALLAAVSYLFSFYTKEADEAQSWKKFARAMVLLHAVSIFIVIFSLFTIIQKHYYEFHYAWNHSSNFLPARVHDFMFLGRSRRKLSTVDFLACDTFFNSITND